MERKELLKENLKSATLVKVDGVSSHSFAENHTYIGAFFQIPNIPFEESDSKLVDEILSEDNSYAQYLWDLAKLPMYEFSITDPFQLHFTAQEMYGEELRTWEEEKDEKEEEYQQFEIPDSIKQLIVNDEEQKENLTSSDFWENFDTEGRVEEGLLILFAW